MGLGASESSRGPGGRDGASLGAYISGGSVRRYCLNKGIGSYLSKRRLSEDKVNLALGAENTLRKDFRLIF